MFWVFCFQASLLTLESTESKVTYLEQGRTLKLNVTYKYSGKEKVEVVWSFNDTVKVRRGPGSVLKFDPRAEIVGQASLHLVNTTLADNGTFSVQAIVDEIFKVTPLNFTVIILGMRNQYQLFLNLLQFLVIRILGKLINL